MAFSKRLDTLGAVWCRANTEIAFYLPTGKAFSITGTVREPRDLGFDITCHSRGLLEHCVRQCTLEHANIALASASTVQGLVYEDERIHGVRYLHLGETHSLCPSRYRPSGRSHCGVALGCDASAARQGLAAVAEGLAIMDNTGGRWYKAERYRLKGKVLVQEGDGPTAVAAEGSFLDALEMAPQGGRSRWNCAPP